MRVEIIILRELFFFFFFGTDLVRENFANIPKDVGDTVFFRARIERVRPMSRLSKDDANNDDHLTMFRRQIGIHRVPTTTDHRPGCATCDL